MSGLAFAFLADGDVLLTDHVELQLRGPLPQSGDSGGLGDECALVGRDVLASRVDLGAPHRHGERHLSQLSWVCGHSSGERPRVAVILGAAADAAEQLAGHRRHRLIHIEQRDALSVVVRSGCVVDALEVLREKRTTFRDRALRLTLAAFGSALGLRIGRASMLGTTPTWRRTSMHTKTMSPVCSSTLRRGTPPGRAFACATGMYPEPLPRRLTLARGEELSCGRSMMGRPRFSSSARLDLGLALQLMLVQLVLHAEARLHPLWASRSARVSCSGVSASCVSNSAVA